MVVDVTMTDAYYCEAYNMDVDWQWEMLKMTLVEMIDEADIHLHHIWHMEDMMLFLLLEEMDELMVNLLD